MRPVRGRMETNKEKEVERKKWPRSESRREAGRIKTSLIKKLLERLSDEPERARFPKGDAR